jgi:hypothetical protein
MEYQSGQWHRDYKPCYPDDSRSEISRDGFIMLFHALLERKDTAAFLRIKEYGLAHDWIMGEGPKEYTSALLLTSILYDSIKKLSLAESADAQDSDSILKLDTFRGNLLAMYIWYRTKLNEKINELEWQTLKKLYEANNKNIIYSALYNKFNDGNQDQTISLMLDESDYPENTLPGRVENLNWSDAPGAIIYLVTLKIIKDKKWQRP